MHLLLFSIVAVCIAGSSTQEIAISTEYLRAHANDSLSSDAATYAQVPPLPVVEVVAADVSLSSTAKTTTESSTSTIDTHNEKIKAIDDDSPETEEEHPSKKDDHAATVTVDLHNILEVIQTAMKASEQRIIDEIHNHNHTKTKVIAVKSYRTATR